MDEVKKTKLWIKLENERRRRKRKLVKIVFLICLFVTVAIASFLFFSEHSLKSVVLSPFLGTKRINIIVAGLDARDHDVGRTDTLMLITIDPVEKKVYQLSIPRDTRVYIDDLKPPDDWDKINATNAYGGPEVTKRTVEEFLGIKVDYWVDLRFQAFADAIDQLGGININIKKPMHYEDPWDDNGGLVIDFKPGEQHLDGKDAIKYVRFRDYTGDIGRVERQSEFTRALLDQVATPAGMLKLPGVIKSVYSELKTDMPLSMMLSLIAILPEVKTNGVSSQMVPGRPLYIDGVSYWIPDIVKTREIVAKMQGVQPTAAYMEDANQLAEKYEASIPDASRTSETSPSGSAAVSPDSGSTATNENNDVYVAPANKKSQTAPKAAPAESLNKAASGSRPDTKPESRQPKAPATKNNPGVTVPD